MILSLRAQVGYASGNFGKALLWTSLDYLLLFYLTDRVGMAPALAGWVILLSLAWDGLINIAIGYWLDRRASAGHDYRPLLLWAPVAAALLFVGIFIQPFAGEAARVAYLVTVLMLFRTAYAVLDVPHNALLAQLPVGPAVRTNLASLRYFWSSIAGLLIASTASALVADGAVAAARLPLIAAAAGLLLCLTLWQSLGPAQAALAHRPASAERLSLGRFYGAALSNRTVWLYLALAAVFAATTPLFAKLLPYVTRYVLHAPDQLGVLLTAMTLGQMAAMPVMNAASRRVGRVAVGLGCVVAAALLLLALYQGLAMLIPLLWLVAALIGFALGGMIMVIWALAGDVADHIARRAGVRTDAGLLALLTMVQKFAIGIGAMVTGSLLQNEAYVAGAAQAAPVTTAMLVLATLLPAGGALISGWLLWLLHRRLSAPAGAEPLAARVS